MANLSAASPVNLSSANLSSANPLASLCPSPRPLSNQIGVAILVLAFVLGFPGNLFVVWSVVCRMRRRSVTCLLVLNLAVADALVLLSAPLFLRLLAGRRGWEFGAAVCKATHYLCCVNMYASIYLISLMSADRWLATTRPFLSQRLRTKRSLTTAMMAIWALAFLFALPMPFYRSNLQPCLHKNVPVYICMPYHWADARHEVFQYLVETLLGFLLPFSFIVACYTSIICRLRSAMFQCKGRGNCLILLIISAFAVFWLPYHLINVLQVIGLLQGDDSPVLKAAKVARPNVTAFAFLSSSVNPVLYVFAGSSHIRRAGLGFMAKLFEGTNSESAHSRSTRTSRGSSPDDSSAFGMLALKLSRRGKESGRGGEGQGAETNARAELKSLTTIHEP